MKFFLVFFTLLLSGYAGVSNHYKKLEQKKGCSPPEGIDYVYLINLDQRPEKWNYSISQLVFYGIFPERFPGIYGWSIPVEVLNDMSLQLQPGMWFGKEYVMIFPPEKNGDPDFIMLNESRYGTSCFSGWTVKGTIGCSLSHLSVLKDAYDSGYDTIWILEDDIRILRDPHELHDVIEELDALTGTDGWDVLYTDYDYLVVDPNRDLESQIPLMWRPDLPFLDIRGFAKHTPLGEKFLKIGSRMRAHSIIYRRCGIEKILRFYEEHNNFLPYDQELAMVPEIQMFVVTTPIVSFNETTSDTRCHYFY